MKNETAFPINQIVNDSDGMQLGTISHSGLTKREYFAALAMQGIVQSYTIYRDEMAEFTATTAAKYADALISELSKAEGELE